MSLATAQDIPLTITVPSDSKDPNSAPLVRSERRITPSWTISELKTKLEPITGIPASSQSIKTLALDGTTYVTLEPDTAQVGNPSWPLRKGNELIVVDLRPPGFRVDYNDVSAVEKYVMPESQYEKLDDSVLAWKKRQQLGRFDPNAKPLEVLVAERREHDLGLIQQRGVKVGARCRVGESDERRGSVRYVGEIEGLGGDREKGCVWVGVEYDEPVGRNDGSVEVESVVDGKKSRESKRVFETRQKHGGFVRPEKLEVGDEWTVLDDLMGSDMEEL